MNGDKHLDLVTVSDGIAIALGNGDGTFSGATGLPGVTVASNSPQQPEPLMAVFDAIDIGDVTGDGKPDIVGVTFYPTGAAGVAVYEGNGDGSFQDPTWQSTAPSSRIP